MRVRTIGTGTAFNSDGRASQAILVDPEGRLVGQTHGTELLEEKLGMRDADAGEETGAHEEESAGH